MRVLIELLAALVLLAAFAWAYKRIMVDPTKPSNNKRV